MTAAITVWAVHPIREDISAAANWGRVRFINERYVYPDELVQGYKRTGEIGSSIVPADELPPIIVDKLKSAVYEFDWVNDYLLIAGDHLQIVMMSAMLAQRYGKFNVLRFDRQAEGYLAVRMVPGLPFHG